VTAFDVIVVAAMEEEIAPFLSLATRVGDPYRVGGSEHRLIELSGREVMLVRGGIGLVNAAGAATTAILAAEPSDVRPLLISAGTAGGLGPEVAVGDIVVGTDHIHSEADVRVFDYALGQVPGMPASYASDETAVSALAAADIPWGEGRLRIHRGLMLSSDSFVTAERAQRLLGDWPQVYAAEMESVALAQTAYSHGVPFVSVRGISDLCGPDEFNTHVDDAAARSAAAVAALLAIPGALPGGSQG
jgi:adenosylhomocysteine nucleosidase